MPAVFLVLLLTVVEKRIKPPPPTVRAECEEASSLAPGLQQHLWHLFPHARPPVSLVGAVLHAYSKQETLFLLPSPSIFPFPWLLEGCFEGRRKIQRFPNWPFCHKRLCSSRWSWHTRGQSRGLDTLQSPLSWFPAQALPAPSSLCSADNNLSKMQICLQSPVALYPSHGSHYVSISPPILPNTLRWLTLQGAFSPFPSRSHKTWEVKQLQVRHPNSCGNSGRLRFGCVGMGSLGTFKWVCPIGSYIPRTGAQSSPPARNLPYHNQTSKVTISWNFLPPSTESTQDS